MPPKLQVHLGGVQKCQGTDQCAHYKPPAQISAKTVAHEYPYIVTRPNRPSNKPPSWLFYIHTNTSKRTPGFSCNSPVCRAGSCVSHHKQLSTSLLRHLANLRLNPAAVPLTSVLSLSLGFNVCFPQGSLNEFLAQHQCNLHHLRMRKPQ